MRRVSCFILFSAALSSCTSLTPAGLKCREWQAQGIIFSTLDACVKCVENMGAATPEAVQGCAVGLEAGALMDSVDGGH
jgi:hypothetical protein